MALKRYKRLTEEDIEIEGKTIERVMGCLLPYKDYSSGLAIYFDDGTYVLLCVRLCTSTRQPVIDKYTEEMSAKWEEGLDTAPSRVLGEIKEHSHDR